MDDFDVNISNGTCYFNVNSQANTITYLAGCTDPGYGAPKCPRKSPQFADQQWVGLGRCDPYVSLWAGCKETDNEPGLHPLPECKCTVDTIILEDKPKLDNIALLPHNIGGSISWYPGQGPTAVPTLATSKPTSQTTSTSIRGSTSTSSTLSPVLTTAPASSTESSPVVATVGSEPATSPSKQLSTSAETGIGLGGGFGVIIIGILIYMTWRARRKSRKEAESAPSSLPTCLLGDPTFPEFRSELPVNEKTELPVAGPNSASTTVSPRSNPPSLRQSQPQRHYQAYNPHVHGNRNEVTNGHDPTAAPPPQTTRRQDENRRPSAYPIFELEG
ncbi:hypothetical protein F4779DRAFT_617089 [Xylariaceae sp. FL0662B]|nr:hypothetical protein F4779DRAFT_617089 [Xylariaceae sp. FL0662B]